MLMNNQLLIAVKKYITLNTVHIYILDQTCVNGRSSLSVLPVHVCQGLVKRVLSDPLVS